ncbi:hypothetical protein N431DRAFT_559173 [Stipitochalara longipes BDJ]|nr:hypothetical protein N431DRAFT_559173 [Stipitochalara longipes BDJ]
MGLPLFTGHKTKPKTKPRPRTSRTMAPASSSSSLEPNTGSPSAQSNTEHSSRRHAGNRGNSHDHRSTPSHRTSHRSSENGTNSINWVQDHCLSQVYEPAYNSAYTYAMYPSEQPVPVPPEAFYHEDQLYYSSTQFDTHESALYDHEIIFEEEQAPTALVDSQQYNSYPSDNQYGSNQYSQTQAPAYFRPQTPAQQYPMQQNISTSPTTARWSSQQLAEERIRLGLPRHATQAEIEAAQRRAPQ